MVRYDSKTEGSVGARRWERLPLTIPVFLRGSDEKGESFLDFAKVLNVSGGGALVISRRYLPAKASISVEIPSSGFSAADASSPSQSQVLPSRLVRVDGAAEYYLFGLEFQEPLVAPQKARRGKVSSAK